MNLFEKAFCRTVQFFFRIAMARYAHREANPLYPVPKLMDARELEAF